jgi:hypothetical protein
MRSNSAPNASCNPEIKIPLVHFDNLQFKQKGARKKSPHFILHRAGDSLVRSYDFILKLSGASIPLGITFYLKEKKQLFRKRLFFPLNFLLKQDGFYVASLKTDQWVDQMLLMNKEFSVNVSCHDRVARSLLSADLEIDITVVACQMSHAIKNIDESDSDSHDGHEVSQYVRTHRFYSDFTRSRVFPAMNQSHVAVIPELAMLDSISRLKLNQPDIDAELKLLTDDLDELKTVLELS